MVIMMIISIPNGDDLDHDDNSEDDIVQELPSRLGPRTPKFFGVEWKTLERQLQGTTRFPPLNLFFDQVLTFIYSQV